MPDYRMDLNNYLQRNPYRGQLPVAWEEFASGPSNHAPNWTAIAYIGGVEYGRGTGPTVGKAKEAAANQALQALQNNA